MDFNSSNKNNFTTGSKTYATNLSDYDVAAAAENQIPTTLTHENAMIIFAAAAAAAAHAPTKTASEPFYETKTQQNFSSLYSPAFSAANMSFAAVEQPSVNDAVWKEVSSLNHYAPQHTAVFTSPMDRNAVSKFSAAAKQHSISKFRSIASIRQNSQSSSSSMNKKKSTYKHVPHREKPHHVVARRNARERRRVQAVNAAFVELRKRVPVPMRGKRVSKAKTLHLAIEYILYLQKILRSNSDANSTRDGNNVMQHGVEKNSTFSASPASMQSEREPTSMSFNVPWSRRRAQRANVYASKTSNDKKSAVQVCHSLGRPMVSVKSINATELLPFGLTQQPQGKLFTMQGRNSIAGDNTSHTPLNDIAYRGSNSTILPLSMISSGCSATHELEAQSNY